MSHKHLNLRACGCAEHAELICNKGLPVQERLKQQKEEASSNPDYDKSFKGQLSKEEKKAKRKQILSNIGAPRPIHTLASQPCPRPRALTICAVSSKCGKAL